jgi:hypothetical protein
VAVWVRAAGIVAAASGLAFVGGTLAADTFSRADAGEAATDLVRPELEPAGLAAHRADFELTRAATDELYAAALPGFAADLGLSPAQFETQVLPGYPAVAALADPAVRADTLAFAEGIVANLEAHQHDFEEADDIPVGWLPMTAGPWVAVVIGMVLVVAGVWVALRPTAAPLVVVAVLGLAAVIGPIAVRYPQKAAAADDLLATLNVTPEIAARTRDLLESAEAAQAELEQRLFPDVAAARGMSAAAFDADLAARFPAVAEGRVEFPGVFERYEVRVQIREGGLAVIPEAKRFPLEAVTWWSVVPGALTAVAAIAALLVLRSSRPRPTANVPMPAAVAPGAVAPAAPAGPPPPPTVPRA